MLRSSATLLATAVLAAVVGGGVAAAGAATGSTGSTGTTSGTTGATGTTGAAAATTTPATVAVNGAGFATVDPNASRATVQADYLTALQSAFADAHGKATMLAGLAGDTLGAVQSIAEQSNDNSGCSGPRMFNAAGSAKGAPVPVTAPGRKHTHHHTTTTKSVAQIADVAPTPTTCTIEADVTVTYSMSAS